MTFSHGHTPKRSSAGAIAPSGGVRTASADCHAVTGAGWLGEHFYRAGVQSVLECSMELQTMCQTFTNWDKTACSHLSSRIRCDAKPVLRWEDEVGENAMPTDSLPSQRRAARLGVRSGLERSMALQTIWYTFTIRDKTPCTTLSTQPDSNPATPKPRKPTPRESNECLSRRAARTPFVVAPDRVEKSRRAAELGIVRAWCQ